MEILKLKGLELLGWRAERCQITSVKCSHGAALSGHQQSAMTVTGVITLELRKDCRVSFSWKAQQLVEQNGATGKFIYSVDMGEGATAEGLIFVDEAGDRLPLSNYCQVIHRLARYSVTNWSNTVSHYLKSLY
ncbi:hypothetical protein Q9R34_19260 [Enterobacter sp. BRE11]|nr:hypothetical protein [Enterobacter sp. BRE11]